MPERRTALDLDRLYDARSAFRIRKGCFPPSVDQKWFTWFDEPILHMHRSWTGYCLFEVKFEKEGDGLRAVSALANREPRQYGQTDDEADRAFLAEMLDDLFVKSPD